MGLRIKGTSRFGQKIATLMAVFALVAQPMYGFVAQELASAAPADEVVTINGVEDLRDAIANQKDNQTWNIARGDYGLNSEFEYNGTDKLYLPLWANNLKLNGIGNPVLYGANYTSNGDAGMQGSFINVLGDNISINNLTVMSKVYVNKAIEVRGADSTLNNVTVRPNTKADDSVFEDSGYYDYFKKWAGSIYYFNAGGEHKLNNVNIYNGGLSHNSPHATLNIVNTNVVYDAGCEVSVANCNAIYSYRFNDRGYAVTGDGTPKFTYRVSHGAKNLDTTLANYKAGDTIKLISDLYINKQVTITKPDVTIDGAKAAGGYYTMFGNFDKTSNSNNSVLSIQADGVRINELNIDGRNNDLHGINTYGVDDLQMWRVTTKNNGFSGLNVNRSWVQGVDLTTANNGWSGVDVDKDGAFFQSAGINHHNETKENHGKLVPDLYIDVRGVGKVNDTNGQYFYIDNYTQDGDRAYFLKTSDTAAPTVPEVTSPIARQWLNGSSVVNSWTASTDDLSGINGYEVKYEFEGRADSTRFVTGTSRTQTFSGTYQGPITISVRAQDNADNWSAYSKPVTYHYDSINPETDINVSAARNGKITVRGQATDDQKLSRAYVQLVHRESNKRYGGTTIHLTGKSSDWEKEFDLKALGYPEGTYSAHVEVSDFAGNRGAAGWSTDAYVDLTSPSLSVSLPAINSELSSNQPIAVSGIATDERNLSRVVMFVDGRHVGTYDSRQVQNSFSSPNGGDFNFTIPAGVLPAGQHQLTVNAYDQAGNNNVIRVMFDVVDPVIDITDPVDEDTEVDGSTNGDGGNDRSREGDTTSQRSSTSTFGPLGNNNPFFAQAGNLNTGGNASEEEEEEGEALGVSDEKTSDKPEVLAATDKASECGKFLGLCWYWWIPITVAVLGAIWFYLAARRESDPDPFSGPARRQ